MKHCDSIKDIYNGLVHKYQFDQFAMLENQTPQNTRYFMSEKAREHMTDSLGMLSRVAYDLGEPEMAGNILGTAAELGSDGIPPMPM